MPDEKQLKARIKKVNIKKIKNVLETLDGARIKTWLNICAKCGLCAESCFFYLANDKNPEFSPAYKIKSTVGEMYKKKGDVSLPFLEASMEALWARCTMCKRCSQFCPFGIDIAAMITIGRSVCQSHGFVPEFLAKAVENYRVSGNQMALTKDDFIETCEWMEEETADEIKGLTIPMDVPEVKFMYTLNAREPMYYPQDIAQIAQILTVAEESWTMPSEGWECTNLPMFAGDRTLAGIIVENMYQKARDLKVDKILVTECGHAYRSTKYEGPYLSGYPDGIPPIEIIHSVELFCEYLESGRIKIDPSKKLKEPVTYQDPCNVSRNGGLWDIGRIVMGYLADDFREMSPNKDYNHCCGGGGGYIPMGPEYRVKRMVSGKIKAEQIRKTGAKLVIVPCHNCFDQINDLNEEYDLGIKSVSIKEVLCEIMMIPDKFKPDEE